MAGIGFELRKVFNQKGLFSRAKAYGYTGVIYAGPMVLGGTLIFGISYLASRVGLNRADSNYLTSMITYAILSSLTVNSFFSYAVTRFASDMLYEEKEGYLLPSYLGSSATMIGLGVLLYGPFLILSGVTIVQLILNLTLFMELIFVWNGVQYLTALKDYKSILLAFLSASVVTFLVGWGLLSFNLPVLTSLLFSVCVGYGLMFLGIVYLLARYFPLDLGMLDESFLFLKWIDKFFDLTLIGFCLHIGIFGHILVVWLGPWGSPVKGLFLASQVYDVPVLLAFLTILVTTINFALATEVHFYPKYKRYYSLFNEKGTLTDIKEAEEEMLSVMIRELLALAWKQLFVTIIAISAGNALLDVLPLGINDLMRGYFRILCVGYGIYAIANVILSILLYFTDYKGALIAAASFAIASPLLTFLSQFFNRAFLGFGFLLAAAIFFLIALWRLDRFTKKLMYYTLSAQPMTLVERYGFFSRLYDYLKGVRAHDFKET